MSKITYFETECTVCKKYVLNKHGLPTICLECFSELIPQSGDVICSERSEAEQRTKDITKCAPHSKESER